MRNDDRNRMMRIIEARLTHGDPGYRDGCRCATCREAHTARRRTARETRRGAGLDALTPSERQTLALMAQGLSNVAIAEDLDRSVNAVGTETVTIYRVLGLTGPRVSKRVAAVLLFQTAAGP